MALQCHLPPCSCPKEHWSPSLLHPGTLEAPPGTPEEPSRAACKFLLLYIVHQLGLLFSFCFGLFFFNTFFFPKSVFVKHEEYLPFVQFKN